MDTTFLSGPFLFLNQFEGQAFLFYLKWLLKLFKRQILIKIDVWAHLRMIPREKITKISFNKRLIDMNQNNFHIFCYSQQTLEWIFNQKYSVLLQKWDFSCISHMSYNEIYCFTCWTFLVFSLFLVPKNQHQTWRLCCSNNSFANGKIYESSAFWFSVECNNFHFWRKIFSNVINLCVCVFVSVINVINGTEAGFQRCIKYHLL